MSLFVTRLRRLLPCALLATLGFLAFDSVLSPAVAQEWRVNKAKSSVSLQLTVDGQAIEAQFANYKFDIRFDPDEPEDSQITGMIDMTSLSTGDAQRDALLYSPEWLNGAVHPALRLASTAIKQVDDGNYQMQTDLTVKDVTKRIVVPLIVEDEGTSGKIRAQINTSRSAFGIGQGADDASDDLAITINLTATHLTN